MYRDNDACRRKMAGAKRGAVAVLAMLLLGACSGPLPLLSDKTGNDDNERQALATTQTDIKAKRMRISSRDILSEWSTFGLEPWPAKRKRIARASPKPTPAAPSLVELPDEVLTIDEIMDSALCRSCEEKPYHHLVVDASNRHGVPTSLIHAVIEKESGYDPKATSPRHARGLMQITPGTARFLGVKNIRHLYDPQTNINAGTAYLKYLMGLHDTIEEVLAAYNSGPGNVRKYKGIPPFKETRRYVRDVKKRIVVISKD